VRSLWNRPSAKRGIWFGTAPPSYARYQGQRWGYSGADPAWSEL